MAGYSDFSKSNNAIWAEQRGIFPASIVGKKIGVPARAIADLLEPDEWHHTSSFYNRTNYYSLDDARDYFASEDGKAALDAWVERMKARNEPVIHRDCRVEWLEWSGSRSRPVATEMVEEGATVTVRGATATIRLKGGDEFKKRVSTKGFSFTPGWSALKRKRREARLEDMRRFDAWAKGKTFEACNYFLWRDAAGKDSAQVEWTWISKAALRKALLESDSWYRRRSVERFEAGYRAVVRVGLELGVRVRTGNKTQCK